MRASGPVERAAICHFTFSTGDSACVCSATGGGGNATRPVDETSACRHVRAYSASRLLTRYWIGQNRSGVKTNAVEEVAAALWHFSVKGSLRSLSGWRRNPFPKRTGFA